MIDWNIPNNLGAIRVAINDVINTRRPVGPIPPPSTNLLAATICQRLVIGGARFKTHIKVDVTAIDQHCYTITYTLAFAQNTNHKLTRTIAAEEHFLDPGGRCCIPILSLHTQCTQVLAAATTGTIFTKGCEAIAQHILMQCHDVHHGFDKWVVQPGTGRFYLVPAAALMHTLRIISTALEELLPTTHILAANHNNPQTTTFDNHTDRPFLRVALVPSITFNSGQHDQIWNLTQHMIKSFQTHENWVEYPTHYPGTQATDAPASSSTAPTAPTPAPLQRTEPTIAGSGPTTAKGPPPAATPAPALAKPSPPQPPDSFSG